MRSMRVGVFTCAVVALCSVATGQSVNIDFGQQQGGPESGYSAAIGGNDGLWNVFSGVTSGVPSSNLMNVNGASTGVNFTAGQTKGQFSGTWSNGSPPGGDMHALLGDNLNLGGVGSMLELTFNGFTNGTYNIAVYALSHDNASGTWRTGVNVNGLGEQSIGGQFGGAYQEGLTHAMFESVVVNNGTVTLTAQTLSGFGSLNGVQFQLVPSPGALALLGMAGLLGARRRRA